MTSLEDLVKQGRVYDTEGDTVYFAWCDINGNIQVRYWLEPIDSNLQIWPNKPSHAYVLYMLSLPFRAYMGNAGSIGKDLVAMEIEGKGLRLKRTVSGGAVFLEIVPEVEPFDRFADLD